MLTKVNRRSWKRYEKKCLVQFVTSLQGGASPATVLNFSKGGLCCAFPEPMEKGTSVMIRLAQEMAGLAREVRGKVKWCVPARMGGYAVGIQYDEPLRWTRYE